MTKHPITEICKLIPIEYTELTGELLDSLHKVFSDKDIHHSKDRDEIFKIVVNALAELEICTYTETSNPKKLLIKQGNKAKEVIQHYGN